ncbi:MAG: D-2-hydroxyacid dehydrogenase [Bdellovibrionota bacterium]
MKIVALDSYTVDFDGLEWAGFAELGELTKYPRSAPSELEARAADADALLVNKFVLNREGLARLPKLRYVGVTATGYNNVDVAACKERSIAVTNVPDYSRDSVAQLVFAFILDHCCHVYEYGTLVRNGEWSTSPDFCVPRFEQRELAGMKLGILGYGSIGQAVAKIGRAFGMEILVGVLPGRAHQEGRLSLSDVYREADVLSLHCPLTPATEGLIGESALREMKPGTLLINTSRGKLLDELAVSKALNEGRLRCACLDVLSTEPPSPDNPLLSAPRTTISPHIAWATRQARMRLLRETQLNLAAFLRGEPRARVDLG